MKQKIQNQLHISVSETCELTKATDIELYVRQDDKLWIYNPIILSDSDMLVDIPYEDAMEFRLGYVAKIQLVFKDSSNVSHASEVLKTTIGELLNEEGYK